MSNPQNNNPKNNDKPSVPSSKITPNIFHPLTTSKEVRSDDYKILPRSRICESVENDDNSND